MKKQTLSLLVAAAFALAACGDNSAQPTQSTTPSTPAASAAPSAAANPSWETYLVGSELSYIPFEYSGDKGQAEGFEIDVLQAVAQAAEFNIQVVNTPRNTIESSLNNDSRQIWASSLSINPERLEKMAMSDSFLSYESAMLVLDTPENKGIKKPEDLAGKTIAYNKSSYLNAAKTKELSANADESTSFYLALKDVYSGKATAVIGDTRVFQYYQKQADAPKSRIIPLSTESNKLGFAVKKGNVELLKKINAGLQKIKSDGTLDKLIAKWFGEANK
ncbi:transporter substrate-binding domain-containing protein [Kingella negevensis]|uniref:Glutamine-binding periplasmic protein n=1 Tax=Kingella negevensis TaxID=1522312 RepID=A0A238HDE7_9NEIS|nr:transporter substrate-binding domain-containing protein [Kingella negevensis]MDK4679243.1 transporter substrate-binding domain-containing protein [Kingella negevensis]MDK4683035.1 transporter substrate-binding domain-containing protein [Kingella negevensis]MDK4691235.1 transporter substrate-binding domain-containing protein [Kingella negevensis]MDK4693617.1 transporter substrate-binding domain-containing protein [Kingella negevensis]MDK4697086.1 transporter substrate-binding domain-containi